MNLTPTTEAKALAIRTAIAFGPEYRNYQMHELTNFLAMLTSASKEEREYAKTVVRKMVKNGADILATEKAAQYLADFANRNEP